METDKEMSKEYRIDSIDAICDTITEENQERFLEDVRRAFLSYVSAINAIRSGFPKECEGKRNTEISKFQFTWIDDGKHDLRSVIVDSKDATISIDFKKQKD